jgi:hypothetical protein
VGLADHRQKLSIKVMLFHSILSRASAMWDPNPYYIAIFDKEVAVTLVRHPNGRENAESILSHLNYPKRLTVL